VHPSIVAHPHLCPQRILDLVHAGANMAHGEDQASSESGSNQLTLTIAKRLRRLDRQLVLDGA
jgi:hypothetical protein